VNALLKPPPAAATESALAEDFATHFTAKVNSIRAATASAPVGLASTVSRYEVGRFRSYLKDSTQEFVVNENSSTTHRVSCSVPQGLVLGPLEFIS